MDFAFTREQEQFRQEVRGFLEQELRQGTFRPREDGFWRGYSREFSRKVGEKGWIGLTWPREYGGQGRGYLDRLVCTEEMLRYGAPMEAHWMVDRQVGPSLVAFGSEQQKREFLPKMLKAEVLFCVGFSEPDSGSDLASVQTRATEDGDDFIINGQKIYIGLAHHADFIWLLARTDPDAPKHRGLSQFMVDLKLPGITVRPLIDMTEDHYINEVFFDNVRVGKDCLVGEKNSAWRQILSQLNHERGDMDRLMANYCLFMDVLDYARSAHRDGQTMDAGLRSRLAELKIEFEVGRTLIYRVAWLLDKGAEPTCEASVAKAYASEFGQRVAVAASQILGLYGQLTSESRLAPLDGRAVFNYLSCRMYTLGGGTSEILRSRIAIRGLGLPGN